MIRRLHRLADDIATGALRTPVLYPDGFGDRTRLERIVRQIGDYEASFAAPKIEINYDEPRAFGRGTLRTGWFHSPTL
ncbi:MAG: hypothetical protein AAF658_21480, partial [Myxococcota bacterium]